jgi:geranylgeranyl diphosphate synthase type I
LQVGLLKSGRYTVTRPLQLGAALGGGDAELDGALTAYGDAVGLAFQLRDDILGLFGDPDVTGKSTLDDVREGKRTLLVVWALERAAPDDRRNLERRLGDVDITAADVDVVRDIVVRTGALDDVEKLLGRYRRKADRALADVPSPAREALAELAELAMERST